MLPFLDFPQSTGQDHLVKLQVYNWAVLRVFIEILKLSIAISLLNLPMNTFVTCRQILAESNRLTQKIIEKTSSMKDCATYGRDKWRSENLMTTVFHRK